MGISIKLTPKDIKNFYKNHPVWFTVIVLIILILIVFIVVYYYFNIDNFRADTDLKKAQKVDIEKKESMIETEEPGSENVVAVLGASDCITVNWKDILQEDWSSGFTWFSISNGVWTIGSPNAEKDAAIYYNTGCTGGSLVDYEVIPRLEEYLNINIYQRGQLRWEIGGGDKRSIKLFKNTKGCGTGEIKGPQGISKKSFLPDRDEILINQPLIIHSALFYLQNGMIRSEIWLTYFSKNKDGEIVTTPRGTYFHDFEPGSICDLTHFPDINQESYQAGIGLQKSQHQPLLLPKVEFNKFRIAPFTHLD